MVKVKSIRVKIIRNQKFYNLELDGCKVYDAELKDDEVIIFSKDDGSRKKTIKVFFTGIDFKSCYNKEGDRLCVNQDGLNIDVNIGAYKMLCVLWKKGSSISVGYVYEVMENSEK